MERKIEYGLRFSFLVQPEFFDSLIIVAAIFFCATI